MVIFMPHRRSPGLASGARGAQTVPPPGSIARARAGADVRPAAAARLAHARRENIQALIDARMQRAQDVKKLTAFVARDLRLI